MAVSRHQLKVVSKKHSLGGNRKIINQFCMTNPHKQLIETICNDILPNMVRIYEAKKMNGALDQDQFVKIIEQKVERANKSLKVLPVEEQRFYREKIDLAYAENIDRLRKEIPIQQAACGQCNKFY
jgi:hypothetical protein